MSRGVGGGGDLFDSVHYDRTVEQAILAMKKGAHLLKCGRRGKPKFCPFRLSSDEKSLIWYSGQAERQLQSSLVEKIVPGQRTVNFQRQLQPDKELQSFSLVYANGDRSLDLICKDTAQASCWIAGLKAVMAKSHRTSFPPPSKHSTAQSCINSPAGFIRRKHNLGIWHDRTKSAQVHSACASPARSLSERCFSDGLSFSSDSFGLSEASVKSVADFSLPSPKCGEQPRLKKNGLVPGRPVSLDITSHRFVSPTCGSSREENIDLLKDILVWGEVVGGGGMDSIIQGCPNQNFAPVDALVPRLLESTAMLDVVSISLGGKHAALVTKQGEVFCWGDGNRGKLGHRGNMDVSYPKVVESLEGVPVNSVTCGEFQTCAVARYGELYMWGDDQSGTTGCAVGERSKSQWLPHKLSGCFEGTSVLSVACGEWHAAIICSFGKLFTFGDGTFGVLGHGNVQSISQPKQVESFRGFCVKFVACGTWHTAAIVDITVDRFKYNSLSGKLFTWGDGDKGRLGHADVGKKLLPTCVEQLIDYDFVQVSCGRMLTVALTNTGKVYTMGSSVHGQLGNTAAKDKSITIVEGHLKQEFVRMISSGSYHIAVLTSAGNVYTWGKGAQGQLGLGDREDRYLPTYVDALKDRQIESIACGSNSTAVICLHRSVSVKDQASCSGCRMPFGFARKRHNCYNCGLQFCRICSGKKVINASLAPDKGKPYRVCHSCFMQKITHSNISSNTGNPSSEGRQFLLKMSSIEMLDKSNTCTPRGYVSTPTRTLRVVESQSSEKISRRSEEEEERQECSNAISSFSSRVPQWGHVSCPPAFRSCHTNDPLHSRSLILSTVNRKEAMSDSKEMLINEVRRLREEARSLEMQCEARSQRIEACQQNIEKALLVAREEAAKYKAANQIVKVLTSKLHALSEEVSFHKEEKEMNDQNLSKIAHSHSQTPTSMSNSPVLSLTHFLPQVKLLRSGAIDSLSASPIMLSSALKYIKPKVPSKEQTKSTNNLQSSRSNSQQAGTGASFHEWVEQHELGVYITFTTLPGGQRGLKRIKFSRKRFSDKEAKEWWEQNQAMVYRQYGIEGYTASEEK